MPDRVQIVHPNGTKATIAARVLPGWLAMGWRLVKPPKTPAPVPDKTDSLAAGSSSTTTEGAQP